LLEDNDVNGIETLAAQQHIHDRLRDHLPAPQAPKALPVESDALVRPAKRGLLEWFRRNKPAP
jgi:hypothetical protein